MYYYTFYRLLRIWLIQNCWNMFISDSIEITSNQYFMNSVLYLFENPYQYVRSYIKKLHTLNILNIVL